MKAALPFFHVREMNGMAYEYIKSAIQEPRWCLFILKYPR